MYFLLLFVLKKGNRDIPGNYRPISLLSIFDKIMEKLMYNRLYSYLNNNKFFCSYQFGFRKNYSTTLALIEVIDNIYSHIDKHEFTNVTPAVKGHAHCWIFTEEPKNRRTIGIYLDLQKAFDSVNHKILLKNYTIMVCEVKYMHGFKVILLIENRLL